MRTCEHCGFDGNRDTARFCVSCGETLSSHPLLSAGTVLRDRYRVVRVLGRGGMGAVYRVEDLTLYGKTWAMKELLERFSSFAEREEGIAQFKQEVQLLVGLHHPNLPQIIDAFEERGRHYLVMEFVEGQTLEQKLAAAPGGCLPEEEVLAYSQQICAVLDYLHQHTPPIVFRDLKPANVMITPDGRVKLIDFGVARLFDPAKGTDTLKMGTAGYAPPEQYAGQGQTTPRSDVYALGATLYVLLTGDNLEAHPFVFTPVRRLNRRVSARTADVVARATQLDPGDRYASASALRYALAQRRRKWLPFAVAGAAVLLVLLAVAVGGLLLKGVGELLPTPTEPYLVVADVTPSPEATWLPTSTAAPMPETAEAEIVPLPSTPAHTPTSTPPPAPELPPPSTPSPGPTVVTEPAATPEVELPSPTALPSPTTPPLPPPPSGSAGSIFYTINAGGSTYYLATTDPSSPAGDVLDAVSYSQSTCSGRSSISTLAGQTIQLHYGYRCPVVHPQECLSPDGQYKVVLWRTDNNIYSVSVVQVADGALLQAIYTGPLNADEPVLWAPDSSRFYFTISHTLHQASPLSAGYQPVLPQAYESYLSPDGSMILFLQPVGTIGAYDVWVAQADGSSARNVTNAPEAFKTCARWGSY